LLNSLILDCLVQPFGAETVETVGRSRERLLRHLGVLPVALANVNFQVDRPFPAKAAAGS
jgi:hypothetical protein